MGRERIDQWCEWGILGLVLAILVFSTLATGAVRPLEFLIVQGMALGVLFLWLARAVAGNSRRLLFPPICWAVLAFVAYAVVRYIQADVEYMAREELIRILIYTLLFFAILNHLHRQESTQIISFVLLALGMGISLYAIYQFATGSDRVWHFIKPAQYLKRGSGTYICPNHLAGFLEMILPLGLAYVFMGKISHVAKVLVGYASLVIMAGIAVSVSRGGWLATGISLMVFFVILLRRRQYRLPALAFLALLVGLGIAFVWNAQLTQKRFRDMFVAGKLEDIRFRLWPPAIQMWRENPWLGVGPGHFDLRFRQYRPEDVQMRPDRVHNDYLNTLADWGVIGLTLAASSWVLLYIGVFRTWKYVLRTSSDGLARQSNKPAFVLGSSIGLMAILLHSAVDFNLHIPANAILASTLIALLSSHLRFSSDRYWTRGSGWIRALAALVCLGGIAGLGLQGVRSGREFVRLEKADKEKSYSDTRIAALTKAFEVEPMNYKTAYEIGESWRVQSWAGGDNYKDLAQKAMQWFDRAMKLNPYDGYAWLRYGMCLHWTGRHEEARHYFERANQLDPNGYYMVGYQGWHLVQYGDYAGAKPWFERSLRLKPADNPIATSYLNIVNRRLSAMGGGK